MSDPTVPPTPPNPPTGSTGATGATGATGGTGSTGATGAPPPPPPGGDSGNRQLMLVLSYLWVLALIPYLTEQRDPEVKWHARHGLVLLIAEVILYVVLFILSLIPVIGCVISVLWLLAGLGIVVLHVLCLVKALQGERFTIPYVTPYADQLP